MTAIQRTWTSKKTGKKVTKWTVVFTMKLPDGSRKRVREISPINKKGDAENYEKELRKNLLNPPPKPTKLFSAFVEDFLTYSKNNNKPSTLYAKESILRLRLIPEFGALKLDEITTAKVEAFKTKMRAEVTDKSINNYLIVLNKLLTLAVKYGELPAGRKAEVKLFAKKEDEFDFLEFDEAERFLSAAAQHYPEWFAMLHTAVKTGLRIGELIELKWEDVDFVAARLNVRRGAWYQPADKKKGTEGKRVVGTPKGRKSRAVDLSPAAVDVLKAHRHLRGAWVFCKDDGKPFDSSEKALKKIVGRVCAKAGLSKRLTWHCLRHTTGSHLVMRGAPLVAVQQILGHTDIKTTLRYAHLAPSERKSWIEALDMGGSSKKEEVK